jgi:hypothetical protein
MLLNIEFLFKKVNELHKMYKKQFSAEGELLFIVPFHFFLDLRIVFLLNAKSASAEDAAATDNNKCKLLYL